MSFFMGRLLGINSTKIVVLTAVTALLSCQAVIGLAALITVHSEVDIHNFLIILLHLGLLFRPRSPAHLLIQNPADSSIRAVLSGCGFHLRWIV